MHTTGRAATKRLNLAEMEDLVRLAHTAHTLTPDLITDTVVDHVGALVRELAHHRLLEMGMQSAHLPRMQPSHRRPLMTRSQDFDAMSAHYGYAPVCAVLSQRFGATFEFTTTAHHCLVQFKIARDGPR
jgi:hypothetical protein